MGRTKHPNITNLQLYIEVKEDINIIYKKRVLTTKELKANPKTFEDKNGGFWSSEFMSEGYNAGLNSEFSSGRLRPSQFGKIIPVTDNSIKTVFLEFINSEKNPEYFI